VQTALKFTVPGVPDVYQGSEWWDLSLVDPDNRRPVDYAARASMLEDIRAQWSAAPGDTLRARLAGWEDGGIKQLLTWRLLELRRQHPSVFAEGDYEPCETRGDPSQFILAFTRGHGGVSVAVAAARFPLGRLRDPGWTRACVLLPEAPAGAAWWNVLSGESLGRGGACDAAVLFEELPVAVLVTASESR
jgi:(1->4)-alpha-D-glucan 1-alpha-D-glucosylmutase